MLLGLTKMIWGFKMIRYQKQIILNRNRKGSYELVSDTGDTWATSVLAGSRTLVSDWWKDQNISSLRELQKDICIGYTWDTFGRLNLFNIYKIGHGYKQAHDMTLAHNPEHNIWVFSTFNDFWLIQTKATQVVFHTSTSQGSIADLNTRLFIGQLYDNLKVKFNPNNESHTL